MISKGDVEVIDFHFSSVRPYVAIASYVASSTWIERNPDLVERFVKAHTKGIEYVNRHPEERVLILTRYTKPSPEHIKRMVHYRFEGKIDMEELRWWAERIYKEGLTRRLIDPEEIVHKTAR